MKTPPPPPNARAPARRRIPLAAIAGRTKLSVDGVEFLLMKALALHLIEGVIDEVDQEVRPDPGGGGGGAGRARTAWQPERSAVACLRAQGCGSG